MDLGYRDTHTKEKWVAKVGNMDSGYAEKHAQVKSG